MLVRSLSTTLILRSNLKHSVKSLSPPSYNKALSQKRCISSMALIYKEFGDPQAILSHEKQELNDDDKLLVKMLAAPVNPSDINTLQGTYPIKPKSFPAIGGSEGVGIVQKIGKGPNPYNLAPGQFVITRKAGCGTWQEYFVGENDSFIPIPKMDIISAATLSVNPCTAYRLLKDYGNLEPGDTVIQNGGNSGVGQAVIQLCREFKLKSVSIVRNRENINELKDYLISLGDSNTVVLTEDELRTKSKEIVAQLALNCVGGKIATDMLRCLEAGGSMVTYGGMSREPVIVPTSQLIFNDIELHGFWMTRWKEVNPLPTRLAMLQQIAQLCSEGKFKPPAHKIVHLSQYKDVFRDSLSSGFSTKFIFAFQ